MEWPSEDELKLMSISQIVKLFKETREELEKYKEIHFIPNIPSSMR